MLVTQSCLTLATPRHLCPCNSPGKNAGVGCHSLSPEDLPDPGFEPRSPALQADSLPSELPGKPTHMCCNANRQKWPCSNKFLFLKAS